ncbi:MAG: tryptophan 2,3-dioxygenase family protein [Schleiferiaceae bacterium]|nr:tryptophan 2,3-dioxygenase family protein [Schleiferiaceae bacterium]
MDDAINGRIEALKEKYAASGQELLDFLDGLLETEYLTYWDYIRLDSLLSLQQPRTGHHDEPIFIMYHQITELYFKLVLHELDSVLENSPVSPDVLLEAIRRSNRYFGALEHSFGVMVDGMDREQFLRFRMALIPASGFQSGQYRMIEIASAKLNDLVHLDQREAYMNETNLATLLGQIYWLRGATLEKGGQKTLTLQQFEKQYGEVFLKRAHKARGKSIADQAFQLLQSGELQEDLRKELRVYDQYVNVLWPLQHYRSAVRYLAKQPSDARATGGTNWQKYLPPRFQKRIFFPFLWSEAEQEDWGKSFVDRYVTGN